MQLKKNPQLDALNKQAVSRTTMQLKTNPQLDALDKKAEFSEKNILPDKKRKGTLLKITFIGVPAVMILAANAIPYIFGSCGGANTPKRKALHYVNSMTKAQQAIYAEEGAFSNSMDALGIGPKTQTTNYNYSIIATKNAAFSYGVSITETKELTSYVGAVFLVPVFQAANKEKTTVSILCAANSPGNTQPPAPILQNDVPVCATGTESLTK
ncbi:type IV pilin-like G/H family protein [Microcoleus sp. B3-A4]|uniref:type IV pilin-like G/H family protein n=1 Tax=Microcoleus sp. B3-A4 TaxID=2818653 RepID=UPI002FD78D07